jgi:hypothetical protein
MFLNSCPGELPDPIGLSIDQYERNQKLIDYNVDYYGFLCTKEYKDFYKSLEGKTLTQDMYESPYFGLFVSSAYAGLDRLYESYKSNLPVDLLMPDPNVKRVTTTTSTISPALILAAAAAAFFFAG